MQVEKDTTRAEEYYGRAILANPSDGELLSLYGALIWETQRDEARAKSYFDQAIHAAPNDWYNLNLTFSPIAKQRITKIKIVIIITIVLFYAQHCPGIVRALHVGSRGGRGN